MNKQIFDINKRGMLVIVVSVIMIMGFSMMSVSAEPYGTTFTSESNATAPADDPQSQNATAGYVSEIDVTGITTTQTWQGYFGNISGTIQLADVDDHQMYNWTLADPEGEIYASITNSVDWDEIQCFNFTALGNDLDGDCDGSAGDTCNLGMNLQQLEDAYTIASDDVDGVNETFAVSGGTEHWEEGHELFYTNNLQFSSGECPTAHLFDSTNGTTGGNYQEVLLYDPDNNLGPASNGYPVFASLIEESTLDGFDGRDHDFEMLVLEDGHGTNTASTAYYFYVELE